MTLRECSAQTIIMPESTDTPLFQAHSVTRWTTTVILAVIGGLLLCVGAWLIGVDALGESLTNIQLNQFVGLVAVGLTSFIFWGIGLHYIVSHLARSRHPLVAIMLMLMAGFLNAVTPFGQVGGDPPAALVTKRLFETDFETGLAAISTTSVVYRAMSVILGVVGISYLSFRHTFTARIETAQYTLGAIILIVICLALAGWRLRSQLITAIATITARITQPLTRVPLVTPVSRETITTRGCRFVAAIEDLASAPQRLAIVAISGIAGQVVVAAILWGALIAVGVRSSFAVPITVIPVAKLGAAAPTPGGLGGAEALLTTLLITIANLSPATAATAAVLYRVSALWIPSLCGGIATIFYLAYITASPSDSE